MSILSYTLVAKAHTGALENTTDIAQPEVPYIVVYERYVPSPPKLSPKPRPLGNACSCVNTAKSLTGYAEPVGMARNWPINSLVPVIGGVVVTNESSVGHTAYISDIVSGELILAEGNYQKCKFTFGRKLAINSSLILGFWKP